MLERILKGLTIVLISGLFLPGCAHYSKSARQQRAYEKYVRKQSGIQHRQQAKYKKVRMPRTMGPSEAKITAEAYSGPQSVSSNSGSASQ
jgi:heat shock protein HslJ